MWGFVSVMLAILVWTRFGLPHPPYAYGSSVDRAMALHLSPQYGALKEDAMLISIRRDGNVFFRDHGVVIADLANEISERARHGAEKRFTCWWTRARYGDAKAILDQIQLAGIEKVSFRTEKPYR